MSSGPTKEYALRAQCKSRIGDMPINHTPQFNSGDVVHESKTRSFDHGSCSSIMVHVVRAKTTSFDCRLRFAEIKTKTYTFCSYDMFSVELVLPAIVKIAFCDLAYVNVCVWISHRSMCPCTCALPGIARASLYMKLASSVRKIFPKGSSKGMVIGESSARGARAKILVYIHINLMVQRPAQPVVFRAASVVP